MQVKLSYEEKILNVLGNIKHKRTDDFLTRCTKEFEAIRQVLAPLYAEIDKWKQIAESLTGVQQDMNALITAAETNIMDRLDEIMDEVKGPQPYPSMAK